MAKFTLRNFTTYLSEPETFGVDVNDDEIKVFQIGFKKDFHKILSWNKRNLPKGVVESSEVKDKQKFGEIFADLVENAQGRKIKGKAAVLSLPENKVFLRILTIPLMSEEEAAEAIRWELEANIPLSINEVYYDWQIVERRKKEMSVLVAASSRRIVDSLIEAFDEIGYEVCVLEADSIAVGRGILSKEEKKPVILIDIGIEGIGYFIYKNGYPVFSSSGSVSGDMFTDAVSKYYGVEWKKAEQMKVKLGLGSNNQEREEMLAVYKGLLTTLIHEVEKTINFYDENLSEGGKERVEKIFVSGGGSNLKGVLPYMGIHLKRQVLQGNPWENLNLGSSIPPISKEEAQSYITVIGLALRNRQDGYFN